MRLGNTVAVAEIDGDYALTTLEFASGCLGHVETTWIDPSGFRTTLEVCGSEGMLEYDSRNVATLRVHSADGLRQESNLSPADDPFYSELRGFLDAVQGSKNVPVSPEDGMKAVAIAHAAIESAKSGKAVTL